MAGCVNGRGGFLQKPPLPHRCPATVSACLSGGIYTQRASESLVRNMAESTLSTRSIDLVNDFMADVIDGQEYGRIEELFAPDYVEHGTPSGAQLQGLDDFEQMIQMFHTAFPDLESTEVVSLASEDGEYVSTVRTFTGTHDGSFMGHEGTGNSVEITGVSVSRIDDGQIAERWNNVDYLGLLQQIDLVAPLDELAA